ncbi:MAG TPA: magnesium transporter [Gammaproteobacteria bacterium]|jgi:magnesium transporter
MTLQIEPPERLLHQRYFAQYPAEATRCLEDMAAEEVAALFEAQAVKDTTGIWERLSPAVGARVMEIMSTEVAAAALEIMDPIRAAALLGGCSESRRDDLMKLLSPPAATEIARAMSYPQDSAGALMDTQLVYYTGSMTVMEALVRLRGQRRRGSRVIFIVDDQNRLQGMVDIQDIALADENFALKDLQRIVPVYVEAMTTREEVVEKFERFRVTDLPVIDFEGRLLGVILYHTLVEAAKAESSADIQTMMGVSKEERALSPVSFVVRKRLPWLQVNLFTAFLAAMVVGVFESTIAQNTALAVLLPVVAGQSGNTGMQALAVTLRGLALREFRARQWPRLVLKEMNASLLNGVAVALTTAAGVYVWSQSMGLCLVIGVSMVISMVIAALSGAAIPIIMTSMGQDPAQSSAVFLTTVTDVMGFFSFLGIATLLSGML